MMRWLLPLLVAAGAASGCDRGAPVAKIPPAPADTTDKFGLVIAEVNGIQITGQDLKNYMEERGGNPNVERHLNNPDILQIGLSAFVDQFVWGEMARRHGIELSHEDAVKLASFEAQLLATRYVAEVVEAEAMPGPEQIEAYYREHQERFLKSVRLGIRHILVDSQAQADALLAQARQPGTDFAALARQHSKDERSRDLGGAMGYVEAGKPVPGIGKDTGFQEAVLPMETGQTAVVHSPAGWHVVLVEKREGGGLVPLDEVRDDISQILIKQNWNRVYNDKLTQAREALGARYHTANFNKFSGVEDNPGRLMKAAGQSPDPVTRIELYRRVAFDFPDAKHAAEAQFMMGYLNMTELADKPAAKSAFQRLRDVFPGSPWRRAGDWMEERLDDPDPKSLGSPREVLQKAMDAS